MSAPEHDMPPQDSLTRDPSSNELSRRDFLKRAAGASAIALTGVGLAASLLDRSGPPASDLFGGKASAKGLGDYSLPELRGKPGRMAIVRANPQGQPDRKAMLERALASLGGLGAFIKPGDRVLLKVNAAFATSPLLGATTHPDLVAAVTSLCLSAGAASVALTDNPVHSPESCFALTGIAEAAAKSGAKVILPNENLFAPVTVAPSGDVGGRLIRDWPALAGAFKGITKFIALSPVKDHHRAVASMTMKNFYGLLGGRRNVFHQDINGVIAELALLARPTLCVVDGMTVMLTNGPTGGSLSDLKAMHVMAVSTDPVAADSFGMELLGRAVAEAPYIKLAETAGAGSADYKALNPHFLDLGA